MKKLLFIILYTASLYAHHPEINYELIKEWCTTTDALGQEDLIIFKTYLQDFKTFVDCCIQNPQCVQTQDGKSLQNKLDQDVTEIMKHPSLRILYEKFTMLIKEEVSNYKETLVAEQRKKEYELLAEVITGCLTCITQ